MLDISSERKKIEKISGITGIGNRYNGYVAPQDFMYSPKGTYINPDGTFPTTVSDPADLLFDTYNGVGYLHQQIPPIRVIVDNSSNATGGCPCKQGKPCPCNKSKNKSKATGDPNVEADVANADAGIAGILQANSAAQGTTTIYWVIGAVVLVVVGVGAYYFIKHQKAEGFKSAIKPSIAA